MSVNVVVGGCRRRGRGWMSENRMQLLIGSENRCRWRAYRWRDLMLK